MNTQDVVKIVNVYIHNTEMQMQVKFEVFNKNIS